MRFRSWLLTFLLVLSAIGPQIGVRAAPMNATGDAPTVAADGGPVPRFESAACAWKLPSGQTEGQTVKCGFVVVPEVHRNPTSPTIRLPVAVFKSTSSTPAPDPIIFLQGGPGGAVDSFIADFLPDNLSTYTANRDLIVFDQRGIGFAQPSLDCPEVQTQNAADDATVTSTTDKISHEIGAIFACRDRLVSQHINLSAYTSAEGAADVNDLRVALGYSQLNLLGVSYGTRLGLTIMRDFPQAVRSAVLDSTVPLQAPLIEENGPNFDRTFKMLFAACTVSSSCSDKHPSLAADFSAAVAKLDTQPVTLTVKDMKAGKSNTVVVEGDTLVFLISQMLYDETATKIIPSLITQVNNGQTSILNLVLDALGPSGADVNVGAYFSIMCSEEVPFNNRDAANAALQNVTPELRRNFAEDIREHFDVCAQWPVQPVNPTETQAVTSDIPALVLSSENDPATPPMYGQETAQTLSMSFLIAWPAIGHSILGNGEACGLNMMLAFIADPTTQPATDCISKKSG